MRIFVDKMPKNSMNCLFSKYDSGRDLCFCRLDNWGVNDNCPETCNYLVKGVVACELAGEAYGEEATGEASESNLA